MPPAAIADCRLKIADCKKLHRRAGKKKKMPGTTWATGIF